MKKGGLARRASFVERNRPDDRANLTVEIGNFSERTEARDALYKNTVIARYFKSAGYDAIGIANRELGWGVDSLVAFAQREELPVVCANLCDRKRGRPVFEPYVLKKDQGVTMGVVGLLSAATESSLGQDTLHYQIRSPYTYAKKWIRKAARKSHHLTVIGDFGKQEIDSLLKRYPEIDLLLTVSSPRSDTPMECGDALVMGAQQKGYYANYIDWTLAAPDTVKPFNARRETLDGRFPDDSLMVSIMKTCASLK